MAEAFLGNIQTGVGGPLPTGAPILNSKQMAAGRREFAQQVKAEDIAAAQVPGARGFFGRVVGGMVPFATQPEAYSGADLINAYQDARARGDTRLVSALDGIIKGSMDEFLARFVGGGEVAAKMLPRLASHPVLARIAQTAVATPAAYIAGTEAQRQLLQAAGDIKGAQGLHPFDPQTLAVYALTPFAVEGFGALLGRAAAKGTARTPAGERATGPSAEGPSADIEIPDEEPELEEPAPPALALARINGGDVPVQIVGDGGNGFTRVRPLDEQGAPGEETLIPSGALGRASGADTAAQPAGETQLPGQPPGTVPGPSAAVPDVPSAEPVSDLQAQIVDMRDPATQRRAVYLSPDNVAALGPAGISELAEGSKQIRNFDRKGGVLIVPDAASARAARDLRAAQPDMQKVLGQLTGAGDGKSFDNTAVVQGVMPNGAVASETSIRPDEIPGVVARVAAEGKTPVVTTPEAAVARRAALLAAEQSEGASEPLEPLGRGPWNPETDPLETRGALEQLPDALAQLEQQETSAPGKKFPAKLPVRQDNASAFASALKAAAIEARGTAPDEVVQRAAAAAKAAERLTHMTPEVVAKGMGTSHTRVSAIIDEMKKSARLLMGRPEAGDEATISPRAAQLKARLERNAARAARATEQGEQRTTTKAASAPESSDVITVQPVMFRGRAMQGLAQEVGFDPDTILKETKPPPGQRHGAISAFLRETAGGLGPNDGWMPYMSALNPLRSKASPLTRSEHIRLGSLIKRFATADAKGAGEARDELTAFMNNILGKRLDEKTQAAVQEYAQARRRMELEKGAIAEEEDTEPGESVYVEDEDSPAYHGYLPEDLDEMAAGRHYADHLWGDIARKLDERGFTRQLERMRDQSTPASLHGLLDLAGQHAESQFARTIIHAIRTHVVDTPVRILDRLEPPEGQEIGPNTAGLHLMGVGRHEIQLRVNHPFAHPLRVLLHEAVHAATVAHLRMEPLSEFSQEIERLWHTARDRTERMLGRPLAPTDYAQSHLYGLKNVREFMAEALSNEHFISHLLQSEKYATAGEKLRNIVSRIGEALRQLFGVHKGPEAKLFHNVVFATSRVMRAQGEKNDFLQRIFEPQRRSQPPAHDALSTADQLRVLHDALEVEGPTRKFRGEDRAMEQIPESLRPLVERFRYFSGDRLDRVRKSVRAWASYDQLIRRGMRHFGSPDDPQNPLRQYDDIQARRVAVQNRAVERTVKVAERWAKLPGPQAKELGQLMIDSTIWGIDPRRPLSEHGVTVQGSTRAVRKYDEIAKRWQALTGEQRRIYTEAENDNRRMARVARQTVVDTVLSSVEGNISKAQRSLLYAVRDPKQFDDLIGEGKPVDLGEFNSMVRETLKDLSPLTELQGPYFHLGRDGSKVVQVQPEGEKVFATKADAQHFAGRVRELGPKSTAKIRQEDDGWHVEYQAKYVSMHRSRAEAQTDAQRMRALGFDVPAVTEKQLSRESAPVTAGVRELLAEAERKIGRFGDDGQGTNEALLKTLRSAFAEMLAAKSERAGSTLARRGVAGVKPEEMRMAYARHAISSASHIGTMTTLFDEANALGRLREAARNPEIGNADQRTMYARGLLLHELSKRIRQDAESRAVGGMVNSTLAKLGFLNYLTSISHALIWTTQNLTTGLPVAGARYGYYRAGRAFAKGMSAAALPAWRSALRGVLDNPEGVTGDDIMQALVRGAAKNPEWAKWTVGANSPLQQLADRGALTSSYANVLADLAHDSGSKIPGMHEAFKWARFLPHLADAYNRISTAIAGLELTNGDVAKTADLIHEVHVNYAGANKPRAFKTLTRIPGGNALLLMKTYAQGMAHLLYGNVYDAMTGAGKSRAEALKTVAGLIVGNALFAGLTGALPEPARWALAGWHHLVGDKDEYWDLNNAIRHWMADIFGERGGEIASEGLPRALGVDVSERMGLSDLFFYNPPDFFGPGRLTDKLKDFTFSLAGPIPEMVAQRVDMFSEAKRQGEYVKAALAAVPVKFFTDFDRGVDLAQHGYQTSMVSVPAGKISGWQDFMQGIGFRPETVANASERAQTVYQYRNWAFARKREIMERYMSAKDKTSVTPELERWNRDNPGMRITVSDLIRAARGQWNAQRLGAGQPGRDPVQNRLLSY